MALDLEKIKNRLNQYENPKEGGGGGNDKLWRLDPGDGEASAIIKLVPYKYAPEDPFLEMWFHYGLAGKNFLCPKKMDNVECDVCNFGWKTLDKYRETKKEEYKKQLGILLPKCRVYVPMVQMDELDKGVRLWGFSPTIHEILLKMAFEFGTAQVDITDPKNSPEFKVTVQSPQKHGGLFNKTEIVKVEEQLQTKLSKLAGTQKEINAILDTCPDISEIYSLKSMDELTKALHEHVGGSEGNESNSDDSSLGTAKLDNSNEESKEESLEDIGSKFEKMLGDEE